MTIESVMAQKEAVLVDCDGVLLDSEVLQVRAWHEAFAEMGGAAPALSQLVGVQDEQIAQGVASRSDADVLLRRKQAIFASLVGGAHPPLVDGALEALSQWRASGRRLALTSNSSRHRLLAICEAYDLMGFFSAIVGARGICPPKPDPSVYGLVLAELRLKPKSAIAIEDSMAGITSARTAGVTVVGFARVLDAQLLASLADYVVGSFSELDVEHEDPDIGK